MTLLTCAATTAAAVLCGLVALHTFAAPPPIDPAATPESLVRAALEAELKGQLTDRQRLLDAAIERDPSFAPARWQAGYLQSGGQWVDVDHVTLGAQENKLLAEYQKRRDALLSTSKEHRELATWCAANGLNDEARLHWTKVLQFGEDPQAMAALQLGHPAAMLSANEREQYARKLHERLFAQQNWHAPVTEIRNSILRGNKQEAATARQQLEQITDPAAIPALAQAFLRGNLKGQLPRMFTDKLARMPGPEATSVLLHIAAFHTSPNLRQAAIEALKKRPKYAVVPQLLAGMQRPVDSVGTVRLGVDGSVTRNHLVRLRGWMDDQIVQSERRWAVVGQSTPQTSAVLLAEADRDAARVNRDVAIAAAHAQAVNGAIQTVLAQIMEMDDPGDPIAWYRRWMQYSEYDAPDYPREIYHQYFFDLQYRVSIPNVPPPRPHSCFPAGTLVATLAGPRAIETIKAGDRVLSQDVETGELKFQLVQDVTLRPPVAMIKIDLGPQSILATRGHYFWVDGRAWVMAKELKAGMRLHGLRGAVEIESVAPASDREAYNLVVGGDNNYFVGPQRLLVHDNMPPIEPTTLVPGLAAATVATP